jgi:hypothetical protein
MSNLRSDCRDLVKDRPAGDVWRTHVERLCFQIDEVEERWHSAERKLKAARDALGQIVCTEGVDRGLVMVDHESRTTYDAELKYQVYVCENFSPLGDALIALWDVLQSS